MYVADATCDASERAGVEKLVEGTDVTMLGGRSHKNDQDGRSQMTTWEYIVIWRSVLSRRSNPRSRIW